MPNYRQQLALIGLSHLRASTGAWVLNQSDIERADLVRRADAIIAGARILRHKSILVRGLVQTIFGKISVIVTLGGGGGGWEGRGGRDAKKIFIDHTGTPSR